MAVTTMRASLEPSPHACAMSSPFSTPGVRMTTSALRPMVSSGSIIWASRMDAAACVAPTLLRLLLLEGDRVHRDDVPSTGDAGSLNSAGPTPPTPITTTVSPGFTLPRSTAEPKPVAMPQLISAAAFMLSHGLIFTSEFSCTTI